MNKLFAVVAAVAAFGFAAEAAPQAPNPGEKVKVRRMTPEMRKKVGEMIERPNSQKGKIAFISTQAEIRDDVFTSLVSNQVKHTGYNMVFEKAAAGDPAALKAASKADVAVIVVADDKTPTLLSAVEDGWAVVNVRKLSEGLSTPEAKAKFLEPRCQKEVLRAFATIGGGIASQYPDNLMDIAKISDLDLVDVFIPNDAERSMRKILAQRGVTPVQKAFYSQACRQGWAPAPTNDTQKAIWDRVHALPTNPIKIKYDPKRDK